MPTILREIRSADIPKFRRLPMGSIVSEYEGEWAGEAKPPTEGCKPIGFLVSIDYTNLIAEIEVPTNELDNLVPMPIRRVSFDLITEDEYIGDDYD